MGQSFGEPINCSSSFAHWIAAFKDSPLDRRSYLSHLGRPFTIPPFEACLGNRAELTTFDELDRFARLLSSSHCTFVRPPKVFDALTIDSQPSLPGPLSPIAAAVLGPGFQSFFENTIARGSAVIKMGNMALQGSQCSPFPWPTVAQWTSLLDLSITATLPSLTTLAVVIVGLSRLDSAVLDVDFVDPSVPCFPAESLSPAFRFLEFGPRGHEFFSWLATSPPGGVHLFSLMLTVGIGDVSPFKRFATSDAHYDLEIFEVTFQADRVAEVSQCLPLLESVNELTVALHFSPRTDTVYEESIRSVISVLDLTILGSLNFTVPSRLGIPWPLTNTTPREDMNPVQLGNIRMRNHIELAALDQEEVAHLQRFANHHLTMKRRETDRQWDEEDNVCVAVLSDRGAVCYS
ncbi:hypothetical protein NMY22_g10144 [Coprinellus aureogranulatus]|nr:hypothetical protein NMY22_g10144 [Coprinellus aureogranulatus]